MSGQLRLLNRQKTRPLNLPLLRRIIRVFLEDISGVVGFDLAVHLIDAVEMARLNETHLGHEGSTDVLTFDYTAPGQPMTGEIFVCVDEALIQARRFRVEWPVELVRYIVHGTLHLRGYDDTEAGARRRMKKAEDGLVLEMGRRFDLRKLPVNVRLRA